MIRLALQSCSCMLNWSTVRTLSNEAHMFIIHSAGVQACRTDEPCSIAITTILLPWKHNRMFTKHGYFLYSSLVCDFSSAVIQFDQCGTNRPLLVFIASSQKHSLTEVTAPVFIFAEEDRSMWWKIKQLEVRVCTIAGQRGWGVGGGYSLGRREPTSGLSKQNWAHQDGRSRTWLCCMMADHTFL